MTAQQQILNHISEFLDKNPHIRFCQALTILGVNVFHSTNLNNDNFYDNDIDVLERINKKKNK
jgi:hypothetical protein